MAASTEQDESAGDDQKPDQGEWELTLPRLIGLVIVLILIWLMLIVFVSIDVANVIVSGSTPLIVVALGYVFNKRLKEYQAERKEHRDEIERRHKERIEFTIDANFYGPKGESFLGEFLIYVHNKSNVKHKSNNINLRVRGLKRIEEPAERADGSREHGLNFPHKPIDENVTSHLKFIFVEPGVKQPITYVTPIDTEFEYVLAHAKFHYIGKSGEDDYQPHSVERLFELPSIEDS